VSETNVVTEFRWIEAGAGIPVLCLHGLVGASEHWETTVETLAPRCRAMALTLPIFETPSDDLSVMGLRAYVEAFMDAERVPSVVVVGSSLTGHVALDLALHAPERVRGLVLSWSSGLFERGFGRMETFEERLGEIRCPTLLVWRAGDRTTPRNITIRMLERIRSVTLRLVPECGRAPALESPDALARALDDFLDSLVSEAAGVS
jgi:pimeloyl-ACP methyl ester carboxylesterase